MDLLNSEIIDHVNKVKLAFVATVSEDNTPNLSPKGTLVALDSETLAFAEIRSPQTIKNIESNPIVEINTIDPTTRKGYRFKGKAEILNQGQEFQKILQQYKQNKVESKINSIVKIRVVSALPVTSPLYDLGYSESEIKTKWKSYIQGF